MTDASQLSPHARIFTGQGGLPKIVVDHPHAVGEIYLHGAHVTHWQPHGHEPIFHMSPNAVFAEDKPIRGGIPICLPWFGPKAGDAGAPSHGFVRTRAWTPVGASEDPHGATVRLRLDVPADASPHWKAPFTAELAVSFGHSLAVVLKVTNTGAAPLKFEEALHTYYRVGDANEATVSGLHNTDYLDKPTGGQRLPQKDVAIHFGSEVDRVYLNTDHPCAIHDPSLGRTITVEKQHSRSTIVWNPAEKRAGELKDIGTQNWTGFVCVETANVGEYAVTLPPGESHEMHLLVRVDGLVIG